MIAAPEFVGELWSYLDARKRVPESWRCNVIRGDGWQREEWEKVCAPGLGHFERRGKGWVYVEPSGYAVPVSEHYGLDVPPPLPKPDPVTCRCREGSHICGACGTPHWVEIHGCADGFCTYCYHQG